MNLRRCQACSTDMPNTAVRSFEDDGETYYVCVDVEACEARRAGKAKGASVERARGLIREIIAELTHGPVDQVWLTSRLDYVERVLAVGPDGITTTSHLMTVVNRLVERVSVLEEWRTAMELTGVAPAALPLPLRVAPPPRVLRSAVPPHKNWQAHQDDPGDDAS